ncbi:ankyrin repeat domain-containing protein [Candidatus Cardinium hertigii]|uniref:ankyrin repeat domain-containing protein n=1 Tax=Candidatus Cardinium hertigii TaxID=247481 RepID=UPI003D7CD648
MRKIRSKVFLSIGLLSLSTFSSCTNTRQSMNQSKEEQGLLKKITIGRPTAGNMRRVYNRNPKKMICLAATGVATILGSAGVAAYSFSNMSSEVSNITGFNNTNFTTRSPYQYESSTIGTFNETGWNSNDSTGSTLAYSAYKPSSTTIPNETFLTTTEKIEVKLIDSELENDANVNEKDIDGVPPIHMAVYTKNIEKFKLLLKNRYINVNQNSRMGTPLTLALEMGNEAITQLLLNHPDINVNEKNSYEQYPIHIAASYYSDPSNLELLLKDKRVMLNVTDRLNNTALDLAEKMGHSLCVNLLKEAEKNRSSILGGSVQ